MRLLLLALLLTPLAVSAQTGTITGTVLEADGVTPIIGANVRVAGTTLSAATDLDGRYRILGVPGGMYNVTASYDGYPTITITDAEIVADSIRQLNFTIAAEEDTVEFCFICYEEHPLITNDAIGQSRILVWWDIENLPVNR